MHMHNPPPYTPAPTLLLPVTPELSVSLATDPTTHDVLISIVPPKEPSSESSDGCRRASMDICCVIDVSGSMCSELEASLEEGKAAERTGLSTLDVVKHAVRTIVETTQPDDRIAIVTFSTSAKIMIGLTPMTPTGKTQVLDVVNGFHTLNSTNLWDGLKTGMNVLNDVADGPKSPVSSARLSTLFLLTDGMPNVNPPRGIIPSLKSYLDSHPLRFSIHTFGFGYTLDSQLLLQIARLGSGVYGFIPDASALGAVFIHAVANLYSTCADRVELNIKYPTERKRGTVELEVSSAQEATPCSKGTKLQVGAVQYGQSRDFVVRMKDYPQVVQSSKDPALSVTVRYRPWTRGSQEELLTATASLTLEAVAKGGSDEVCAVLRHHSQRLEFINVVNNLFKAPPGPASRLLRIFPHTSKSERSSTPLTTATDGFNTILTTLQSPPLSTHASSSALAQDIAGEVLLALSDDNVYQRWGQHYLPSLARWHLLQQCGSFRDPGLQVYGTESPLFTKSREALDQAFDSLPPPEPSIRHSEDGGRRRAPHSMSVAFAARSGPCFHGACEVMVAGGRKVQLKSLRRGMCVVTPKGIRKVVAVLETHVEGGQALLCELPGGLKITPWHPIKFSSDGTSGRWVFPISQSRAELQACEAVYSLLLEPHADPDAHAIYIEGVLCVTLGHGITGTPSRNDGDIRAHGFLGDYGRILRSLVSVSEAGSEGVFRIAHVLRDDVSGTICGFASHECADPMYSIGLSQQAIVEVV